MNSTAANDYTTPLCSSYSLFSITLGLFHFHIHTVLQTGSICQYLWSFCYLKGILRNEMNRFNVNIISANSSLPLEGQHKAHVPQTGHYCLLWEFRVAHLGAICSPLVTRPGWEIGVVPSLSNNVNLEQRRKKVMIRESAAAEHTNACRVAPGHCPPHSKPL